MIDFKEELDLLEEKGLRRRLRVLGSAQADKVIIDGKECINLCSNNYLGLADDPRLKDAAINAINKYGVSTASSRLVSGNNLLYTELEEKIAAFKGMERALVFNSGYSANLGIISSIVGPGDIIFSDKLNHASIVDGIILSGARFKRYTHKDMGALENLLKESNDFKTKLIITDTVFSMDGDIAPLAEISSLAKKYGAQVMVDEAHASGVLEEDKDKNGLDIRMGTFSKALGSFGAYVAASSQIIEYFINKARSLIFTTALPPAVLAANMTALDIIQKEPQRRAQLLNNADFLRSGLRNLGFDTLDSQTAIIPILVKDSKITMEFSSKLFAAGISCSGIRPPTVPQGTSRLRITVMATHKQKDLDYALEKIGEIGKELGII